MMVVKEFERGPVTITVTLAAQRDGHPAEQTFTAAALPTADAAGNCDTTWQAFGSGDTPDAAVESLLKNLGVAQSKIMKALKSKDVAR